MQKHGWFLWALWFSAWAVESLTELLKNTEAFGIPVTTGIKSPEVESRTSVHPEISLGVSSMHQEAVNYGSNKTELEKNYYQCVLLLGPMR